MSAIALLILTIAILLVAGLASAVRIYLELTLD